MCVCVSVSVRQVCVCVLADLYLQLAAQLVHTSLYEEAVCGRRVESVSSITWRHVCSSTSCQHSMINGTRVHMYVICA